MNINSLLITEVIFKLILSINKSKNLKLITEFSKSNKTIKEFYKFNFFLK